MSEKSAGDRDDDHRDESWSLPTSSSSSSLSSSASRCPECFIASLSSIISRWPAECRQRTPLRVATCSSPARDHHRPQPPSSSSSNCQASYYKDAKQVPDHRQPQQPSSSSSTSSSHTSLYLSTTQLQEEAPSLLLPSSPPWPSLPSSSSSSSISSFKVVSSNNSNDDDLPLLRLTDRHFVHHSSRLLSSRSSHYASDAFSPQQQQQQRQDTHRLRKRRQRSQRYFNSNASPYFNITPSCSISDDGRLKTLPVGHPSTSNRHFDNNNNNDSNSNSNRTSCVINTTSESSSACCFFSSSSSSSSSSFRPVLLSASGALKAVARRYFYPTNSRLVKSTTNNSKTLVTTFYILSVFLLLFGCLPCNVAATATATNNNQQRLTVGDHQPSLLSRIKSSARYIDSYDNYDDQLTAVNDDDAKALPSYSRQRRQVAVSNNYGNKQQPPIFRSAEYIFAQGTDNVITDEESVENSNSNNNYADVSSIAATQFAVVNNSNSSLNATVIHPKPPPVVWVPYLGVIVILAVFMVLIVTFWLHIRHSRYRAIQLVKSSPNSEWNEIQPGRWEASYGGHVYTVNQINQTRVLGAIAAAAVAAMGAGAKQVMSGNRSAPDGTIDESVSDGQIQDSSAYNNESGGDGERTRLIASGSERTTSTGRTIGKGSLRNKSASASGHASIGGVGRSTVVPVSDSIWILTEEQLIESIRSSNGSHKSTPAPTPTTATTMTSDGLSTSTATSAVSHHLKPGQQPPYPPPYAMSSRAYGTFSSTLPSAGLAGQQVSSPSASMAQDAVSKLAMVEMSSSCMRASSSQVKISNQSSLPLNAGEIALETVVTSVTKMSPLSCMARFDEITSQDDVTMESEDVCNELPMPGASGNSQWMQAGGDGAIHETDEYFGTLPSEFINLASQQLSLDEMTLPEPEPWTPPANANYSPAPVARISSAGRGAMMRSNAASAASLNQSQSGSGSGMGATNILAGRRMSSNAARGSVRGRGRGAAGRGQLSSLIAYSNMSKKKSGFIIPRG